MYCYKGYVRQEVFSRRVLLSDEICYGRFVCFFFFKQKTAYEIVNVLEFRRVLSDLYVYRYCKLFAQFLLCFPALINFMNAIDQDK